MERERSQEISTLRVENAKELFSRSPRAIYSRETSIIANNGDISSFRNDDKFDDKLDDKSDDREKRWDGSVRSPWKSCWKTRMGHRNIKYRERQRKRSRSRIPFPRTSSSLTNLKRASVISILETEIRSTRRGNRVPSYESSKHLQIPYGNSLPQSFRGAFTQTLPLYLL